MEEIHIGMLLFLIIAGFTAAFIDSVVGGGGLISLPALLFTGLPPQIALGTNKLASTMGSLTSSISFIRHGKINKSLMVKLLPLSIIGSAIGVYVVQKIPSDKLKPLILVILIVVTIYTLTKKEWGLTSTFNGMTIKKAIFAVGIVTLIGFYDGFLGGGTGSFFLFAFLLMGFDFVESAGNAKILNFGSNITALVVFFYYDSVYYQYGIPMGIAMIAGALIGSKVAIKKGSSYVKILFVLVSVVLIGKNIYDHFFA
ncbi:sulfite exporter TauE/SafE family protein [Niallia sp. 03133]|uniref:sulfite exporter TauE/SafE family protein n=1 Tax=Niallia sp. 03133 TaxID=3458060 RepID=UPI004044EBD3